jgi:hypothetical protein
MGNLIDVPIKLETHKFNENYTYLILSDNIIESNVTEKIILIKKHISKIDVVFYIDYSKIKKDKWKYILKIDIGYICICKKRKNEIIGDKDINLEEEKYSIENIEKEFEINQIIKNIEKKFKIGEFEKLEQNNLTEAEEKYDIEIISEK